MSVVSLATKILSGHTHLGTHSSIASGTVAKVYDTTQDTYLAINHVYGPDLMSNVSELYSIDLVLNPASGTTDKNGVSWYPISKVNISGDAEFAVDPVHSLYLTLAEPSASSTLDYGLSGTPYIEYTWQPNDQVFNTDVDTTSGWANSSSYYGTVMTNTASGTNGPVRANAVRLVGGQSAAGPWTKNPTKTVNLIPYVDTADIPVGAIIPTSGWTNTAAIFTKSNQSTGLYAASGLSFIDDGCYPGTQSSSGYMRFATIESAASGIEYIETHFNSGKFANLKSISVCWTLPASTGIFTPNSGGASWHGLRFEYLTTTGNWEAVSPSLPQREFTRYGWSTLILDTAVDAKAVRLARDLSVGSVGQLSPQIYEIELYGVADAGTLPSSSMLVEFTTDAALFGSSSNTFSTDAVTYRANAASGNIAFSTDAVLTKNRKPSPCIHVVAGMGEMMSAGGESYSGLLSAVYAKCLASEYFSTSNKEITTPASYFFDRADLEAMAAKGYTAITAGPAGRTLVWQATPTLTTASMSVVMTYQLIIGRLIRTLRPSIGKPDPDTTTLGKDVERVLASISAIEDYTYDFNYRRAAGELDLSIEVKLYGELKSLRIALTINGRGNATF